MKKLILMLSMVAFVTITTMSCKQGSAPANEEENVLQIDEAETNEGDTEIPAVDESQNIVNNAETEVNFAEKALESAVASGDKEAEAAAQKILDEAKANLETIIAKDKDGVNSEEKGVEEGKKEDVDPSTSEKTDQ